MKRLAATVLFAFQLLAADQVIVTEHGKTYHARATCMALSHTKTTYTATEAAAKSHGLKPCGICYRQKSNKPAKPSNGDWATKGGK